MTPLFVRNNNHNKTSLTQNISPSEFSPLDLG